MDNTKLNIDLNPALDKSIERIQEEAERNIRDAAQGVARSLFSDGRYGGKEGLAHEIIRKKIEDYVLSEEFSAQIEGMIPQIFKEESANALRALLNSKARKHLFQPTSPVVSER